MLSSAKKRCEILGAFRQMWAPCNSPFLSASLIRADNPSAHKGKGKEKVDLLVGVRFQGKKGSEGSPSTRTTEYDTVVTHLKIHSRHLVLRPIFSIILFLKNHSTLSYALLISSLIAKTPFFPRFFSSYRGKFQKQAKHYQ